jgi:TP901 family phage tail tape measure protein
MIEIIFANSFLEFLVPFVFIVNAVTLLVLRSGASKVFFDIVGTFQAQRLIKDAKASQTVFEALYLDSLSGIQEGAQELSDIFTEMTERVIPIVKEIEEARIELEKFMTVTGVEARIAANEITEIGLAFGFSADQSMLAGAKMAQLSGVLGAGSLSTGTEIGMAFGLISGMETDAAMQRMINLQAQTKFMTEGIEDEMSVREKNDRIRMNSLRILNQLNTVENRSVATMEQITFVMNQFASQAELTNESIASMAALSATLIEAGEEQGKGGRALRMMYARLGADINGSRKAVEDLGIAVADNEGNMRAFSDVLQDLAVEYNKMSGERKTELAQTVAGNRHYTRLIKLLENVDRVKELEFEATIAMFPAMDEIERRRGTEIFALQKAEMAYKNYSALLGEELVPAMTKVTNKQALIIKDFAVIVQKSGRIGEGLLGVSKAMETMIGPTFNMLLNIQNMTVAMDTNRIISRALAGEGIAGLDNAYSQLSQSLSLHLTHQEQKRQADETEHEATLRKNNALKLLIQTQQEYNDAVSAGNMYDLAKSDIDFNTYLSNDVDEEGKRIKILKRYEDFSLKMFQRKADRRRRDAAAERKAADEYSAQVRKQIDIEDRALAAMQQSGTQTVNGIKTTAQTRHDAHVEAVRQKEELLAKKREHNDRAKALDMEANEWEKRIRGERKARHMDDIAESTHKNAKVLDAAQMYNGLTASLLGAGSAMMLFSNNQNMVRGGMVLNGAAMLLHTIKMLGSITAFKGFNTQQAITIYNMGVARVASLKEIYTNHLKTVSQNAYTMSIVGSSKAMQGLAASAMMAGTAIKSFLRVSGPLVLLGLLSVAAMELAEKFNLFSSPDLEANMQGISSASLDTAATMDILNEKLSAGELEARIKTQTDLVNSLKDATGALQVAAREAAQQDLLNLTTAQNVTVFPNLDTTQAQSYFDLLDNLDKSRDSFKHKYSMGHFDGEEKKAQKALDDWIDSNEILHTNILQSGAEDYRQYSIAAKQYKEDIENQFDSEINGINTMGTAYDEAKNKMTDFMNEREEMFYGFSKDNLTGDLVRQVTQQGVETLITTTEVVMTNNFNGISVPQMVDIIIDEIEGRGRTHGFAFSNTA